MDDAPLLFRRADAASWEGCVPPLALIRDVGVGVLSKLVMRVRGVPTKRRAARVDVAVVNNDVAMILFVAP